MCCLVRLLLTSSVNSGDGRGFSGRFSCQMTRQSAGVLPGKPRDPFTPTPSPSVILDGETQTFSLPTGRAWRGSAACGKRSCTKRGGGRVTARTYAGRRGRGQPRDSAGQTEGKSRRKQKSLQNDSKKGNVLPGGLSPHKPSTGDNFSEKVPAPVGGGGVYPRPAPLHHPNPRADGCSVPSLGGVPLSRTPPAAPDGLLIPRFPRQAGAQRNSPRRPRCAPARLPSRRCSRTRLAHLSCAQGVGTGTSLRRTSPASLGTGWVCVCGIGGSSGLAGAELDAETC